MSSYILPEPCRDSIQPVQSCYLKLYVADHVNRSSFEMINTSDNQSEKVFTIITVFLLNFSTSNYSTPFTEILENLPLIIGKSSSIIILCQIFRRNTVVSIAQITYLSILCSTSYGGNITPPYPATPLHPTTPQAS